MWKRTARGRELHFYLAGINNQNFLMRDRETGSWWQQVTGRAIAGELAGSALELMPNDELTFALWKSETPQGHGLVLAPVSGHEKDYDKKWEEEVAKYPVPLTFPGQGLKDRDVILGVEIGGQARAFPLAKVRGESPVEDKIGGVPVALVTGPDGESVRVFRSQLNGLDIELYRDAQNDGKSNGQSDGQRPEWRLVDSQGNTWNFAGCATSGPAADQCLEKINFLKDYWFDWKNYNPRTTVYSH
ncbi:conserved hypothetical protein [Candidatus Sulfotelmatobacter sp. SbA7]|nr:conserved hypothetical protein [Candidatus Sulfotelmatobacter sp. SbA7]